MNISNKKYRQISKLKKNCLLLSISSDDDLASQHLNKHSNNDNTKYSPKIKQD